ncbi:MAG TPA: lipocalin family protein [Dissulfurispiraceae bacterium]|nr:lipocalin family protein [Dissulfurispiraceae bacterium]
MVGLHLITLALILCAIAVPVSAEEFADVTPSKSVAFPGDMHYRDDYKVQWWYLTGHLRDDQGRLFGYELTFFVVGVQKRPYRSRFGLNNIYISHFALTDVAGKRFSFSDVADRGAFASSGTEHGDLLVWTERNQLQWSGDTIRIRAGDDEKAIDFLLVPEKKVVLHGNNGYSRKSRESPLSASLYFSLTRLMTTGTLRYRDKVFRVTGSSWFDRELSTRDLEKEVRGWDWFAIQLDDGRDIMIYRLRRSDGTIDPFSSGTIVERDGSARQLSRDDVVLTVLGHYTSKKTRARYPSRWRIAIPSAGIDVTVIPSLEDQECVATRSTLNHYWEGTCSVEGSTTGRAYVELTGY